MPITGNYNTFISDWNDGTLSSEQLRHLACRSGEPRTPPHNSLNTPYRNICNVSLSFDTCCISFWFCCIGPVLVLFQSARDSTFRCGGKTKELVFLNGSVPQLSCGLWILMSVQISSD